MGFFDFLNRKTTVENTPESDTGLEKEIIFQAQLFLKKYGVKYNGLDFSVKSLEVLETLLLDAGDFYQEMSEDQQKRIIEGAGSYIFEVARTNVGGDFFWYQKLDQPILVTGLPKFRAAILSFDKVKSRLEKGAEEDIPSYFEGYLEGVKVNRSAIII